jgi:Hemerythrin HHE cation binding domain
LAIAARPLDEPKRTPRLPTPRPWIEDSDSGECIAGHPSRRAYTQQTDVGSDIVSVLVAEHGALRAVVTRMLNEQRPLVRRNQARLLARLLVRHETAEQRALYPVIARIDGGSELRREMLDQERELARLLAGLLRRLTWRTSGRKTLRRVRRFGNCLEDHLMFEEASVIPILLALEDDRNRQLLGTWLGYARLVAPTRPHPFGPQRLPGLLTIGVVLAVLDRITDKVTGRNRLAADSFPKGAP